MDGNSPINFHVARRSAIHVQRQSSTTVERLPPQLSVGRSPLRRAAAAASKRRPCNALAASTGTKSRSSASPSVRLLLLLLQVLFKLAVLTRAERSRCRCKLLGSSNNAAVYTRPALCEPSSAGSPSCRLRSVGSRESVSSYRGLAAPCCASGVRESRGPRLKSADYSVLVALRLGSLRRRRSVSAAEPETS